MEQAFQGLSLSPSVATVFKVVDGQKKKDERPPTTSTQLLYMDAMNFGSSFFPFNEPWNMTKSNAMVRDFVAAAARSGFELKVFLDDAAKTAEAVTKWRTRRVGAALQFHRQAFFPPTALTHTTAATYPRWPKCGAGRRMFRRG